MIMKTIIVLLILFGFHNLNAQCFKSRNRQRTFAFGVQTGGTVFYGDISRRALLPQNRNNKKDFGTASSFSVRIKNSKRIEARISMISGTLNGIRFDVPGGYQRYFTNTFNEADLTIAFDPFKKRKQNKKLTIAGIVGLGVIHYRAELRSLLTNRLISTVGYAQQDIDYPQLKESDRRTDMVGIAGGSVSYKIHQNFELLLEHSYRMATSSKLDAIVSGGFNDCYSYTSFGMNYKINSSTLCVHKKICNRLF